MRKFLAAAAAMFLSVSTWASQASAAMHLPPVNAPSVTSEAPMLAAPHVINELIAKPGDASAIDVRHRRGLVTGLAVIIGGAIIANEIRRSRRHHRQYNRRPARAYRYANRCEVWWRRCEYNGNIRACRKFDRNC